ncbi:DUF4352 domain-containing protein [Streptomyces tuirus]|uniref:DUF4352 domain-containing protein n=1 Tax=Streptomyces tuirus TaxID=68278 RepID=A0A941F8W6_9ACTN|nr:DUF4352 domain-containing protein [Streptomyces tuirus]
MNTRIRLAAVVAVAALAVTACGSGATVTDQPKPPASTTSGEGQEATAEDAPAAQKVANVGDTIELAGSEVGSKLDVTVVKVADNATSSVEGFAPEDGNRWIGVQFQLVNTGTVAYGDSPANGTQVYDKDGQQFGTMFADITAGPSMSSDVKLKPGAKALGWIVFEVPKGAKLATVQFAMDSGLADQVGEWKLS